MYTYFHQRQNARYIPRKHKKKFGLVWFWFIGVLRHINDISVIYVTAQMCRRTEEEVVPTVGLPTP